MMNKESTVDTVSVTSTQESNEDIERGHSWQPSVYRLRPFVGLAALFCTILCLIWSLGILIGSNGAPTKTWYFQPTVYLALATAISNMSLQCALIQACPISWWNKALKGSTIQDLELEYEAGQSLLRAIYKTFRQRRLVGPLIIASIASTLVVIDGPLLQRSSSVFLATIHSPVNLNFSISQEIPRGFSGAHGPDLHQYPIYRRAHEISRAFIKADPITSPVKCEGVCTARLHGPGLIKQVCHDKSWKITPITLEQRNVSWGSQGMSDHRTPFLYYSFTAGSYIPGPEPLFMYSGWLDVTNGEGHYFQRNCTFVSGIIEYHLSIKNDILSFASPPSSSPEIAVANNTYFDYYKPGVSPMELAPLAFQVLINYVMDGLAEVGDGTFRISEQSISPAMVDYGAFSGNERHHGSVNIKDPMPDMVSKFDELLLRAGLMSASWSNLTDLVDPGLQPYQIIRANSTKQENVFNSDLTWFAGAATVQMIAILLIVPVFWGWWRIGVDLSMSPFHIAKMFGSPVLDDVSSAAGTSAILKKVGSRRVKLGIISSKSSSNNINGQSDGGGLGNRDAQLRVDELEHVVAPRRGDSFRY